MAFRLAITALLNILLMWALDTYLDEYVIVSGGWPAYVIIGALMTLLNLTLRPFLNAITLPLRLLATLLAIIIVNGVFLWIVYAVTLRMDPDLVVLTIDGGIGGWIVVALVIGVANWAAKLVTK